MGVTARDALTRTLDLTRLQRLPGASEDAIVRALASVTVAIVADERNLSSAAAQAAVSTLVGLVIECGMRVRLVLPRVHILGYQPPLIGNDLTVALQGLGADSVPGAEVVTASKSADGDLVFVIGDTAWSGDAALAWRIAAGPWRGEMLGATATARPITSDFPMGALAAATAAAAEPYRAGLRTIAAQTGCEVPEPWQLEPASAVRIELAQPGTATQPLTLSGLDIISGGSLTSALLHALLRVPGLVAAVRVWEPQVTEWSNLNRYVLLRRSMVGDSKVDMLAQWQSREISISGHQDLVDQTILEAVQPWAPWVFVGTDNVEARWLVQGSWPEHLVVAGTAGFMALASEHDRGRPCAGCLHAWTENVDGVVPTVSFVSYLAGLLAAARLLRWAAAGPSVLDDQASEAWADRLDGEYGYRSVPVQRLASCAIGCNRARSES